MKKESKKTAPAAAPRKYLDIELYRKDSLVFGRVIHQDERLRCGPNEPSKVLFKLLGLGGEGIIRIVSLYVPGLDNFTSRGIELRVLGGDKREDGQWFSHCFGDEAKAEKACALILKGVDRVNSDWSYKDGVKASSASSAEGFVRYS